MGKDPHCKVARIRQPRRRPVDEAARNGGTAVASLSAEMRPAIAERRTRHLRPAILILLREGPDHGYSLLQRLPSIIVRPEDRPNFSVFYRILKGLDAAGALRSTPSDMGGTPRRRLYRLTDEGRRLLEYWIILLQADAQTIDRLLAAAGRPLTAENS